MGGENSVSGAERFERDVISHHPDLVLIAYGLNDRRCGLEKVYTAWNQMIKQASDRGIKVVLLTPSPDQSVNYADPANDLKKQADQNRKITAEIQVGLVMFQLHDQNIKQCRQKLSLKIYGAQGDMPSVCNGTPEYLWKISGNKDICSLRERSVLLMKETIIISITN